MDHTPPFHIPESVMHETFDDEVVVVNLLSGAYFSLRGIALELWAKIETGATEAELVETLQKRASAAADGGGQLHIWLDALRAEGLLEATSDLPRQPSNSGCDFQERLASTVFADAMEKFTDVEGLLLLDPIHEVDDAGWPKAADRSA